MSAMLLAQRVAAGTGLAVSEAQARKIQISDANFERLVAGFPVRIRIELRTDQLKTALADTPKADAAVQALKAYRNGNLPRVVEDRMIAARSALTAFFGFDAIERHSKTLDATSGELRKSPHERASDRAKTMVSETASEHTTAVGVLERVALYGASAVLLVRNVQELGAMLADNRVLLAHEPLHLAPTTTFSLPLIRQKTGAAYPSVGTGAGVSIAVLEVRGVANVSAAEFSNCSNAPCISTPNMTPAVDAHATNVSAIAAAVAPGAQIISIYLEDKNGDGFVYDDWFDWVHVYGQTKNIRAMNMSFCSTPLHSTTCDKYADANMPQYYDAAFLMLIDDGVTLVAASGNDGYADGIAWPAINSKVISVGAVYSRDYGVTEHVLQYLACLEPVRVTDKVTCFTNVSNRLDMYAPGAFISAGGVPDEAGTSQAAPHVAGAAAVLAQLYPNESVVNIKQRLTTRGPLVQRDGIQRRRLDLLAAASNPLSIYSYLDGQRSGGVSISLSVADRATPEALETLGPWAVTTDATMAIDRWYLKGKPVTLTAPPTDATQAPFAGWYGGCTSVNVAARQCTVSVDSATGIGVEARYASATPPPANTMYRIDVAKSGSGTVLSDGGAINCGSVCNGNFNAGTNVRLTATPLSGSSFVSWSNCPSVSGNVCSFSAIAARIVTANFSSLYTLNIAKIGTGLVQSALGAINCGPDCSASLAAGTPVTLTAGNVPGSGYTFSGWSNCPSPSGVTCTISAIAANTVITATFAPSTSQCTFSASPSPTTIAVSSGGTGYSITLAGAVGCALTVSNSNTAACVTNVSATIPGAGSAVLSVVVNSTAAARSCTIGVTGLSGTFVFNQSAPSAGTVYTITRQVATNGGVGNSSGGFLGSLNCPAGGAVSGATCSVTATANAGYAFAGWTENSSTVSNNATYSFTVGGDRTLTANFVTSVSYVSYVVDVIGPPEARVWLNNAWYARSDTGPASALLQVGTNYTAQCSTVPNWQLTNVYGSPFTAVASPPGLVQCQYQQTVPYLSPTTPITSQPRFAAGKVNSIARAADGRVLTWGYGQNGALGDGQGVNRVPGLTPTFALGLTNALGVHSSRVNPLQGVVLANGTFSAWGFGDIASGTGASSSTSFPTTATSIGSGIQKLSGSYGFDVLRANGQFVRYENGVTTPFSVPANVVDFTASSGAVHVLDREGRVWALNYGLNGTATNPVPYYTGVSNFYSTDYRSRSNTSEIPTPLPGLSRVISLANAGSYNTFALKADGTVWVWGFQGALLGSAVYPSVSYPNYEPVQISGLQNVKAITAGNFFALALDNSGNVWSWGDNAKGQLGRPAGTSSAVPAVVVGLTNVAEISGGVDHALAMKTDGTLWAWGANDYGMLGDGTTTSSAVPVQVRCPSGYTGFVNLLVDSCTPNANNILNITAFSDRPDLPAAARVVVNGVPVFPPYQVSLPAGSTVTLDITAPIGFAGGSWSGELDTSTSNVVQLSLPMNRDWKLTPWIYSCQFTSFNDATQSNIPAAGTTFTPNVNLPDGTFSPKQIFKDRCGWETIPSVPWVHATPSAGNGSPIITTVTVDRNSTASARTGTMLIGGVTYTFNQLAGASDAVPDAFAFNPANSVPISTVVIANRINVSGINAPTPISIAGGGEYSINGAPFTAVAGTVNIGDEIAVRRLSSASYSTSTSTTLTIGGVGGVSATFVVTTRTPPVPVNGSCGTANGGVYSVAPTVNLCAAGTASPVVGAGPWTWSCQGLNGGANSSCVASLPANFYSVTTSALPIGAGTIVSVPGASALSSGAVVTFTATPSSGFVFSNWSGAMSGTQNPLTVTVSSSNLNLVANFAAAPLVAPVQCRNMSSAPSLVFSGPGARSDIQIAVDTPDLCSLTAVSDSPWWRIVSGATGGAHLLMRMDVDANVGIPRTGTITVTDAANNVWLRRRDIQPGSLAQSCTYTISQPTATLAATAASVSPTITTQAGCAWSVVSEASSWLTVSANGSGSGSGAGPTISAVANTSASARAGQIYYRDAGNNLVAGLTVTQLGAAVDGQCGPVNGGVFASPGPAASLKCAVGGLTSNVTSTAGNTWQCAGANGGIGAACALQYLDTDPNSFSFAQSTGVSKNSVVQSGSATIVGINGRAPVSIVGGEYSVGCTGIFTGASSSNAIANGESICVRHTSAVASGGSTSTTLSIGTVVATFVSVTELACNLHINGDTSVTANADGALLVRYLLGFRGASLIAGIPLGAARADAAAIETYLGDASPFDIVGRSGAAPTALVDGLILTRLLQGVPDAALLNGIKIAPGAQFRDAASIRANVNAKCGTAY